MNVSKKKTIFRAISLGGIIILFMAFEAKADVPLDGKANFSFNEFTSGV